MGNEDHHLAVHRHAGGNAGARHGATGEPANGGDTEATAVIAQHSAGSQAERRRLRKVHQGKEKQTGDFVCLSCFSEI